MIIVSQDKEEIVNFDNIENIWIDADEEGRFTIEATADTNSTLGYYKTKERAKEVLKEIQSNYTESELLKVPSVTPTRYISGLELIKAFEYEMPLD